MADISTLGIAVDSSDVKRAADDLDKLAQQGGKTESAMQRLVRSAREFGSGFRSGAREGMREFTTGTQGVATASRNAQSSMDRLTRSARDQSAAFSSASVVLRRFIPILATFFSANAIIKTTDAYTSLNARLLLATGSSEKFAIAQAKLSDIAHRSRAGIEETSDLFAKLALATGELGVSQTELLGVTETINQAMQVSGASAQESAGALRQLGQAFASGVLRGEELNSVMEQAPRLARAIADGMGVSIGALRQMGSEGQLTAEKVFGALQKSGKTVADEFSKLPLTVGGASTQVKNALFELVGSFTSGVGASKALAEAISDVAEAIREIAKQVPHALKWISDLIEQFKVGKDAAGGFWSAMLRYGTEFRDPDKAIADTTREIEKLQELIRRDERAMAGDGFRGLNSRRAAEERNKARREEIAQLERDLRYFRLLSRQQIPDEINQAMDALGGTGAGAAEGGRTPRAKTVDPQEASKLRKAMMDAETAAIRRGLAEWTSAYAASETILEAQRSAGLVSEQDYYNRKRRLIEDTAETQVRALQEENKLIAAQNVSGPERIKALSQIADNETKISDIRRQAMVQVEVLGMRQEAANKAAARSFEEARLAAQNYLDTLVQQQRREVEMMGMGERARERQAGLNQIDDRYTGQRQELENQKALLQMERKWTEESQAQYTQRLAIINDYHGKARESYEEFWRLRSARETDGLLGMTEGLRNYADEANNIYAQMGDTVANALRGMEDALVSFTMTGKADFKGLVNSIIADLARIQIKKALGSLTEGLGSGSGIGSILGALFKNADGNVYQSPSLSRYSSGVYNTPQFFAFAKGAGVFAEAGPEAIMPLKRGKDGKLGVQASGGGITINSTVHAGPGTNVAELSAYLDARDEQLKADIADSLQRGRMVTA